jgi:L-aspartate oxidase
MEVLAARAIENDLIHIYEDHMAIDLITDCKVQNLDASIGPNGETLVRPCAKKKEKVGRAISRDTCVGVYALDTKTGSVSSFAAQVTFLATGGAGRVYLYTSNPDTATGDGLAMYCRLGYPISNMEFMQFHPTCFYNPNPKCPDQRRFLVTEALRGKKAGGRLTLSKNSTEDFVKALGYHQDGSASTRDVVAKAIDTEMKKRGMPHVWLNVTPEVTGMTAEQLKTGYPVIYKHCLECGVDLTKEAIPVVPAAHYTCGGIPVDLNGCTQVERLYAVGECSYTGLHGANRLASNSLSEAALYGVQAAEHAISKMNGSDRFWEGVPEWQVGLAKQSRDAIQVAFHWDEVRHLMWNLVGIARTAERLLMAKARIEIIMDEVNRYYWNYFVTKDLLELRNIATVSEIIIQSALLRPESRGGHCRVDDQLPISPAAHLHQTVQPELEAVSKEGPKRL